VKRTRGRLMRAKKKFQVRDVFVKKGNRGKKKKLVLKH